MARAQAGLAGQTVDLRIRIAGTQYAGASIYLPIAGGAGASTLTIHDFVTGISGSQTVTLTATQTAGTSTTAGSISSSSGGHITLMIEDMGI
jgi:hypothetical protein